jgi:hypothetical protein
LKKLLTEGKKSAILSLPLRKGFFVVPAPANEQTREEGGTQKFKIGGAANNGE